MQYLIIKLDYYIDITYSIVKEQNITFNDMFILIKNNFNRLSMPKKIIY